MQSMSRVTHFDTSQPMNFVKLTMIEIGRDNFSAQIAEVYQLPTWSAKQHRIWSINADRLQFG
ncbi:hypothetical protein AWV79_06755 [Cupriavidus sp. UYMMa02A]|nr:hypothetical protein AWV79_06755 [Cupriavidus sp. UYMMa02A]